MFPLLNLCKIANCENSIVEHLCYDVLNRYKNTNAFALSRTDDIGTKIFNIFINKYGNTLVQK